MEVKVSEDELPGIFYSEVHGEYSIPFAQIPVAVDGLRKLADKLEGAYERDTPEDR